MSAMVATQVLVVGSGKLAKELLQDLSGPTIASVRPWSRRDNLADPASIVVHAGSGREWTDVVATCEAAGSLLVELATGNPLIDRDWTIPVVVCPNVNLLVLKVMAMLSSHGVAFQDCDISLVESHQASKSSAPGTAFEMADALGLDRTDVRSVRDPVVQEGELGIPREHLSRHAFHRIRIQDGNARVLLETTVLGEAPYAPGLARILEGISARNLSPGVHHVVDLVGRGWI